LKNDNFRLLKGQEFISGYYVQKRRATKETKIKTTEQPKVIASPVPVPVPVVGAGVVAGVGACVRVPQTAE